jgi:hypothetical protein
VVPLTRIRSRRAGAGCRRYAWTPSPCCPGSCWPCCWPRWRHGSTGTPVDDREASALLRRRDGVGAYLLADLPVDLAGLRQGSGRPAYVHTDALAEHHLVRHAVAAALAGTTSGRALAGRDADGRGPEAVATLLAALVAQVDDPVSAPSALRTRATRAHRA